MKIDGIRSIFLLIFPHIYKGNSYIYRYFIIKILEGCKQPGQIPLGPSMGLRAGFAKEGPIEKGRPNRGLATIAVG